VEATFSTSELCYSDQRELAFSLGNPQMAEFVGLYVCRFQFFYSSALAWETWAWVLVSKVGRASLTP
jgi:hypothetical protein